MTSCDECGQALTGGVDTFGPWYRPICFSCYCKLEFDPIIWYGPAPSGFPRFAEGQTYVIGRNTRFTPDADCDCRTGTYSGPPGAW